MSAIRYLHLALIAGAGQDDPQGSFEHWLNGDGAFDAIAREQLADLACGIPANGASPFVLRELLVRQYAWAIPTPEAVDAIAALSPIVEVGAGTGYWTMLLRDRGARIEAYESRPVYGNDYLHRTAYTAMARGAHHRAMRRYGDRTLLLCWPPPGSMSGETLCAHRGEWVAYIGEGLGGATADDEFFALLEQRYTRERTVALPQWPGIHDQLELWRRAPQQA